MLKYLLYAICKLLHLTYRYRYFGLEHYHEALRSRPNGAFAIGLWHCNAVAGLLAHRSRPFSPMISQSRDGELISFFSTRLGLVPVRGSSSKGAVSAQRQLAKIIEDGRRPAYTVDGPRGPRFKVKSGIIGLAAQEGLAALPMAAVADRCWEFRSWDRFRLPKPFARIAVAYEQPIRIDPAAGKREWIRHRQQFEEALLKLEDSIPACHAQWSSGGKRLEA